MTNVAIVEDDWAVRENLALLISKAPGFSCVATCESAEEALLRLPALAPDVVLMDINLPGKDGISCVAGLREVLRKTQVIMLTIEEDSEKVFESMKAGATGYLVKHVSPQEILEAVAEVHRGGAPMSSHIARKVVQHFHLLGPSVQEAENLSPREREVLDLLSMGFIYKEIGSKLNIGSETVRTYVKNICQKMHVRSRLEAVAKHRTDTY